MIPMNARTIVPVLLALLLSLPRANGACAACGSGDTSLIQFRGSSEIEIAEDGTVIAVVNITDPISHDVRTSSSPNPGVPGVGRVVTEPGTLKPTVELVAIRIPNHDCR